MTFALLWCERCGRAEEAPRRPELDFATFEGPLVCGECREPVTLLEGCQVAGTTVKGRIVAYEHNLPARGHR